MTGVIISVYFFLEKKKERKKEETNKLINRGVKFILKKDRRAQIKGQKGGKEGIARRERRRRGGGGKRIRVTLVIFHTIFNDGSFN